MQQNTRVKTYAKHMHHRHPKSSTKPLQITILNAKDGNHRMTSNSSQLPYYEDASLNATLLLQKQIFQFQSHSLSEILSDIANTKVFISSDMKVPSILQNRTLTDEYAQQGRLLDNEEISLLGVLDQTGKVSVSSRLNELMLLMTRITKAEHRGLCIHILSYKLSEECASDFTKFGGLRIIKRWLRLAEESDRIAEMTALVKLCNKLPFNELAVKEVGIGKVIRKLLKFQSPSGSDVTSLHAEIEKLMANWRAKQMEIANNRTAASAPEAEKVSEKPLSGLVLAVSDRLTAQRGRPADPSDNNNHKPARIDNNESKGDSIKSEYPSSRNVVPNSIPSPRSASSPGAGNGNGSQDLRRSATATDAGAPVPNDSAAMDRKPAPRPVSILPMLQRAGSGTHSQEGSDSLGVVDLTSSTGNGTAVTPSLAVKPPVAFRERKPLDMAEGARKLLAMRAQQALAGPAGSPAQQVDGNGSPVHSHDSSGPPLSPSTSNVLSILSAVGKARIASGLPAQLPVQKPEVVLRSALKKSTVTAAAALAEEGPVVPAAGADAKKKEKKVIHWADENGGLLREVRTIEVARIKRSTAHYSSTRELSKRERMAEKETHLSKAEDAMQRTTEWRTPAPLLLSIVVLDNITIVADSAEKIAQDKRLAHVLEVRYADDSRIPADPDEAPSVHEVISSSGGSGTQAGTSAGDDSECTNIPWYIPGTEPPPEKELPLPPMDPLAALAGGTYLDDAALARVMLQLPYSLHALEFSVLRALVQDPAALQAVLRPDGSVDEFNLAAFQRNTGASRERTSRFDPYRGGDMGGSGPPIFLPPSDLNGPGRRSRFRDAGPDAMHGDSFGGGAYGPGSQPLDYEYDYDPYGPPRSAHYDDRPPADWNVDYGDTHLPPRADPLLMSAGSRRTTGAPQQRFSSTKAATPCRFFNTAKGCQFGDKCSFGHFLPPSDLPPVGAMDVYLPDSGPVSDRASRWGSAPAPVAAGPGTRRFGPGDRVGGPVPMPMAGPGMGARSGPGSRLHSQFSAPPSAPSMSAAPMGMTQPLHGMPPVALDPAAGGPNKRTKRFN